MTSSEIKNSSSLDYLNTIEKNSLSLVLTVPPYSKSKDMNLDYLNTIQHNSLSLVLTNPPYMNTIGI